MVGSWKIPVAGSQTDNLHSSFPAVLPEPCGIEPGDAACSASQYRGAVWAGADGTVGELVALQPVLDEVVVYGARRGCQTRQSVICPEPYVAAGILTDAANGVVGHAFPTRIFLPELAADIAPCPFLGTQPHPPLAVSEYGMRKYSVVGYVCPKDIRPAHRRQVKTAQSHGRGYVYLLFVARHCQSAEIVVGDAVHLVVNISPLCFSVGLRSAVGAAADESLPHCSEPHVAPVVLCHIEDADAFSKMKVNGMIAACEGIYPSTAVTIGAGPYPAMAVLPQRYRCRRQVREVSHQVLSVVQVVDAVLVSPYPEVPPAVYHARCDTVAADDIAGTEAIAYISERCLHAGAEENAFLHQPYPDVALTVLDEPAHLALRKVYVVTVKDLRRENATLRIILPYASSVASDEQFPCTSGEYRAYRQSPCPGDGAQTPAVDTVDAIVCRCKKDAMRGFSNVHHGAVFRYGLPDPSAAGCLLVDAVALSDDPQAAFSVFHQLPDILHGTHALGK